MSLRSLGFVSTTSGTPVRLTANETDPTARFKVHSLLVEQVTGQTGKVYIGERSDMNIVTLVGVVAILAIPTTNILSTFSATIAGAPGAFNLADVWLDVDVDTEGALISCVLW